MSHSSRSETQEYLQNLYLIKTVTRKATNTGKEEQVRPTKPSGEMV